MQPNGLIFTNGKGKGITRINDKIVAKTGAEPVDLFFDRVVDAQSIMPIDEAIEYLQKTCNNNPGYKVKVVYRQIKNDYYLAFSRLFSRRKK